MTPIKRRLLYIFRGSLLRLRITWNHGQSLTLSVGYHVDKIDAKGRQKWDGTRCKVNSTHGESKVPASTINRALEQLEEKIDKAFYDFEKSDLTPSQSDLKNRINGEEKPREKNLFEAFDEFIKEGCEISQWSLGSIKKFKTMKALLKKFRRNLRFSDFNADLMKELMAYQTKNSVKDATKLDDEAKKGLVKYAGKYQNTTINKNMSNFKWFLRWAYQKGYIADIGFLQQKYALKSTKRPVIFLTWDELMKVYSLDLSGHPELTKTRDMFCLCCFTSLRYSDLTNLRWGNVSEDCISITTMKTSDSIVIDLNDYSREILDKYRKVDSNPEDSVFDSKSSQKMNDGLKVIGKLCKIDSPVNIVEMYGSERKDVTVPKYQLLSTHCGRRTFICNALALGVAPNIVMKWTGHSDYKAMKPYIDIADDMRKKAMDVFNRKN